MNLPAPLAKRLEADPNFLYKLGVEIAVDEGTSLVVNTLERGLPWTWGSKALLQVVSQGFNAALNDTALVWWLAPKAGEEGKKKSALPAHAFEQGNYTTTQRFLAVLNKAYLYSIVGALTGIFSLVPSYFILNGQIPAINHIGRAAFGGALALGVSANIRYNLVNGIEVLMYSRFRENVARLGTVLVRFCNIYAGARLFITIARLVNW